MSCPPIIPPPFFHQVCVRWTEGRATAYDTAVLTSLTTNTPLPFPHDPLPVGFDAHTRLPFPDSAPLYNAAKNAARQAFHKQQTQLSHASLTASFTSPLPPHAPFPDTLGAAPARAGLRLAASTALGGLHLVEWRVQRAALVAAGAEFCIAARVAGWRPMADESGDVVWRQGHAVRDVELADLIIALRGEDVIPAGCVDMGAGGRAPGARARWRGRVWLRLRVCVGMYGISKSRKGRFGAC